MRHAFTWAIELVKLFSGQRLHPLSTECPICRQMVRLHVDKGGRRHMYAHARSLYEGSRFYAHDAAKMKCPGSSAPAVFDQREEDGANPCLVSHGLCSPVLAGEGPAARGWDKAFAGFGVAGAGPAAPAGLGSQPVSRICQPPPNAL